MWRRRSETVRNCNRARFGVGEAVNRNPTKCRRGTQGEATEKVVQELILAGRRQSEACPTTAEQRPEVHVARRVSLRKKSCKSSYGQVGDSRRPAPQLQIKDLRCTWRRSPTFRKTFSAASGVRDITLPTLFGGRRATCDIAVLSLHPIKHGLHRHAPRPPQPQPQIAIRPRSP